MLGSVRRRRILTFQLLLGVVVLAFHASVPNTDGLQGPRKGLPPRRARRLASQIHPRTVRQINASVKRITVARFNPDNNVSDHDQPLVLVVLPEFIAPPFGEPGLPSCNRDLAQHIVFPPRYLVFCSFLC
jgi:hypothetical protein